MSIEAIESAAVAPVSDALEHGAPKTRSAVTRTIRPSERRFFLLLIDAAASTAGVLLALWTWTITAGAAFSWSFVVEHRAWLLAIPLWLVALAPTRNPRMAFDLTETSKGIANAGLVLFLAYLVVFFYAGREALPRLVAIYVLWNCTLMGFGGRLLAFWMLTHAALARKLLVVGERDTIETTIALFAHPDFLDIQVIGTIPRLPGGSAIGGVPVVGTPDTVDDTARALGATDIVLAVRGEVPEHLAQQLLRCQEAGIDVLNMARLYEQTLHRLPIRHLGPTWVVTNFLGGVPASDASPLAKRVLDIAVGTVLATLALPVVPFLAFAVVVESGLPVFYRQVRLGRAGRPFVLTKFRTMRQDAEKGGVQWAQADDPRSTRVGRFLRRTRLDELPNLWAVLRGDLSMVGPRPERPEFLALLEQRVPLYRARLTAAPGLTGWAQINHEYGDSEEDAAAKLEYDLYYIKHQSLWFDLVILTRTIWTMLRLKGR